MTIDEILELVNRFLRGDVGVRLFCELYEDGYNFKFDKRSADAVSNDALNELFKVVVFYSEHQDEIDAIPNYKSEEEVRVAAAKSFDILMKRER